MYIQERSRNPRNLSMMLDAAHIIIGILIVVLAVISFLNPVFWFSCLELYCWPSQ